MTTENLVKHGFLRPLDMTLTENSNQLFGGGMQQTCKIAHISQFGPYTKKIVKRYIRVCYNLDIMRLSACLF